MQQANSLVLRLFKCTVDLRFSGFRLAIASLTEHCRNCHWLYFSSHVHECMSEKVELRFTIYILTCLFLLLVLTFLLFYNLHVYFFSSLGLANLGNAKVVRFSNKNLGLILIVLLLFFLLVVDGKCFAMATPSDGQYLKYMYLKCYLKYIEVFCICILNTFLVEYFREYFQYICSI